MTIQHTICPFCNPERELIAESELSIAIFDKFPVNAGHVLIIPKRHCADFFNLTFEEQCDCIGLLNKIKIIVQEKYTPAGFNVGINKSSCFFCKTSIAAFACPTPGKITLSAFLMRSGLSVTTADCPIRSSAYKTD